MLDKIKIENNLNYKGNVIVLDTVDSTNTFARKNALQNGDIVVTNNQTNGKGRMGRIWESFDGIAMSVNIIPTEQTDSLPIISIIMGVAVCNALKEITALDLKIKWPNDIVINGKKLCGILTEAVTENNKITKIICGAGINVLNKDFGAHLNDTATSLFLETSKSFDQNEIVYRVANEFYKLMENGYTLPKEFIPLCVTLGKEVTVIGVNESYKAVAKSVNPDGSLNVETPDGAVKSVSSGEVSVRGFYNYL